MTKYIVRERFTVLHYIEAESEDAAVAMVATYRGPLECDGIDPDADFETWVDPDPDQSDRADYDHQPKVEG